MIQKRVFKSVAFWLLLVMLTTSLSAQNRRGFDLEGNLLAFPYLKSNFSLGFSGRYNVWLTPHLGYTVGVRFITTRLDAYFSSADHSVGYTIDDRLISLRGEVGIKLLTPTYKRVGLFSDLTFLFAPIPFNFVSVDRKNFGTGESKYLNKMVYTQFSPGYSLKIGPFYRCQHDADIALGVEITNFNPCSAYYRTTFDKIRLKERLRLKPDEPSIGLFIRCSGIW